MDEKKNLWNFIDNVPLKLTHLIFDDARGMNYIRQKKPSICF